MSKLTNFYKEKAVKKYNVKYDNPCFNQTQIKHPFRGILIGGSGSGKTMSLLNIIKYLGGTWDYIVLCCKTQHEPLYQFLINKCAESISVYEEGKLPSMEDIDKVSDKGKNQVLVIFDDLCLMKDQRIIEELYSRGRKKNCSLIYLSQSFYKIPKTIRINSNLVILKKLATQRDLKMILKDYDIGMNEKQLLELYQKATDDPLNFLTIRLDCAYDSQYRFTKNFVDLIK